MFSVFNFLNIQRLDPPLFSTLALFFLIFSFLLLFCLFVRSMLVCVLYTVVLVMCLNVVWGGGSRCSLALSLFFFYHLSFFLIFKFYFIITLLFFFSLSEGNLRGKQNIVEKKRIKLRFISKLVEKIVQTLFAIFFKMWKYNFVYGIYFPSVNV